MRRSVRADTCHAARHARSQNRPRGRVHRLSRRAAREGPLFAGFSSGAYRALQLVASGAIGARGFAFFGGLACVTPEDRAGLHQFATAARGATDLVASFLPLLVERSFSAAFRSAHPAEAASAARDVLSNPKEIIADDLDALADSPDLRPALPLLSIPIVACVGSADVSAPATYSEEIVRLATRARLSTQPLTPITVVSGPVGSATKGLVLETTGDPALVAYDLTNGTIAWTWPAPGRVDEVAVGDHGLVYALVTSTASIYVLSTKDGSQLYRYSGIPAGPTHQDDADGIMLRGGRLFVDFKTQITSFPIPSNGYDPTSTWPVRFHDNQRTSCITSPMSY